MAAGDHSPFTAAFLRLANEKNLPIEQLFKRIRLDVGNSTDGQQTPWESSSLTSDFYFFGDTAVAATRTPAQMKMAYAANDLPSRSSRQAYEYVLAENSVENYQEFIRLYPYDPMSDRIRILLGNLMQAKAWHIAVQTNSAVAYKSFYDKFSNGPYAQSALKMAAQPKLIPLSQPTRILAPASIKLGGLGPRKAHFGSDPARRACRRAAVRSSPCRLPAAKPLRERSASTPARSSPAGSRLARLASGRLPSSVKLTKVEKRDFEIRSADRRPSPTEGHRGCRQQPAVCDVGPVPRIVRSGADGWRFQDDALRPKITPRPAPRARPGAG